MPTLSPAAELLDLQAAATTRIARGEGQWQLAGYALADTHDSCTLRDGGSARCAGAAGGVIGLDQLLSRLTGQSMEVSDLRHEVEFSTQRLSEA